jgi:hypothetical protein
VPAPPAGRADALPSKNIGVRGYGRKGPSVHGALELAGVRTLSCGASTSRRRQETCLSRCVVRHRLSNSRAAGAPQRRRCVATHAPLPSPWCFQCMCAYGIQRVPAPVGTRAPEAGEAGSSAAPSQARQHAIVRAVVRAMGQNTRELSDTDGSQEGALATLAGAAGSTLARGKLLRQRCRGRYQEFRDDGCSSRSGWPHERCGS